MHAPANRIYEYGNILLSFTIFKTGKTFMPETRTFTFRLFLMIGLFFLNDFFLMIINKSLLFTMKNNGSINYVIFTLLLLFTIFTLFIFIKIAKKNNIANWHWKKPTKSDVGKVLFYTFLLLLISNLLSWYFESTGSLELVNQEALSQLYLTIPLFLFVFLLVIHAPIIEELLFRAGIIGYLFPNHPLIGITISTFLFTIVHMPTHISAWAIYGTMGFIFAWVFYRSKRLEFVIFIHMINNIFAIFSIAMK